MKFATYRDGSRDGQLVVVSRDLSLAQYASRIANRLQQVVDDWNFLSPQMQDVYDALNAGRARNAFAFDADQCMAPIPRAYQWVTAGPGPGAMLAQGPSDDFLAAQDPLVLAGDGSSACYEVGVAAVTGDIAAGSGPTHALDGVRLLMLFGHAPALQRAAFAPVAVTPDELGDAWAKGAVNFPLHLQFNGRPVPVDDMAPAAALHLGPALGQLSRRRRLRAGSIVGVLRAIAGDSNRIAAGDRLRLEIRAANGLSIFGAIQSEVQDRSAKTTDKLTDKSTDNTKENLAP
jgi:fumarylacetoacetate (FAA) hydrolase